MVADAVGCWGGFGLLYLGVGFGRIALFFMWLTFRRSVVLMLIWWVGCFCLIVVAVLLLVVCSLFGLIWLC